MLNVEWGIVVSLQKPRIVLGVDQDIQADDVETLPFWLGEGGVVVVFQEREHSS